MNKVLILTTGGTIEGHDYNISKPKNLKTKSISAFLKEANISSDYSIDCVSSKDSRYITDLDRDILVNKIRATSKRKIIITHGTITMCETAKFIGKFNLDKTIVLVGSFRLGTKNNTDAPFNLGFALCAAQILQPDVYIAMNGKIFHWSNVTKNQNANKFEQQ